MNAKLLKWTTPVPWRIGKGHIGLPVGHVAIYDGAGVVIAEMAPKRAKERAEHIVACVNAHDELVAEIAAMREALLTYREAHNSGRHERGLHPDCDCACCGKARAALAKGPR